MPFITIGSMPLVAEQRNRLDGPDLAGGGIGEYSTGGHLLVKLGELMQW